MNESHASPGPHDDRPVYFTGDAIEGARLGAILVHGRGADAHDILGIASELGEEGVAFAAPDAASHTWYPYGFLSPIEDNEPGISSGLRVIDSLVARFAQAGIASERLLLLGFSQGACLTLEYVARHPRRFGAVVGLSGGLIGPPGTPRDYAGSLDGSPVFLGCSDADPHIPKERVLETAEVLKRMGAAVTTRLYPRLGHTINHDEITAVRKLLASMGP
jgi:predicted esterase